MPLRSAREVIESRKRAVQLAVSCVCSAVVQEGGQHYRSGSPRVAFLRDPVRLQVEPPLYLGVQQHYHPLLAPGSSGDWEFRLTGYSYALDLEGRGEVLGFHWHARESDRFKTPHLHMRRAAGTGVDSLAEAHVPTGIVLLEDVLRLAIEELGVTPARLDWSHILDATRAVFLTESL